MENDLMSIVESPYFYPIVNTVIGIILAIVACYLIPIILNVVLGILAVISAALAPLLPYLPVALLIVGIFVLPEDKASLLSSMVNVICGVGM